MRPLRLELEGFTCYRDPQPALDLSAMTLFAIAGPTGAGKSTILDAMLYALYGRVPRMDGKQGLGEFVSHGRDVLSVCLDFSLSGRNYRLTRRAKKTKKHSIQTEAIFAEMTPEGERNIAGGAGSVDSAIEALLGLDFSAFTQTVILPQNQFARFLQSSPKEQRQILQHLLRHEVYDRMRGEAERRKGLLERDVRGKEEQLAQVSGATPVALAALHDARARADVALGAAQVERASASGTLQDVRGRRELTLAIDRARLTARNLENRSVGVVANRTELERAQAAAAVRPLVEAVQATTRRADKCASEMSQASLVVRDADRASATARKSLEAAEAAAVVVPSLRATLQKLDEIRADVDRKPVLAANVRRVTGELAVSERRVAETKAKLDTTTLKAESATLKAEKARTEADSVSYDAQLHARFDGLREDASRASAIQQEIEELRAKADRAAKQAELAKRTLTASIKADDVAKAAQNSARAARQAAEHAHLEGHRREAAGTLRQDLAVGEPCPVCEQVIAKKPRRVAQPRLDVLTDALSQTREAEEHAADRANAAVQDLARAESKLADLYNAGEEIAAEVKAKERERQKKLARIAGALTTTGDLLEGDVVAMFEAALIDMRRTASLREQRLATATAAQQALQQADVEVLKARSESREAAQHAKSLSLEVERLQRELGEVTGRIAAATSAADPAAERESLSRQIAKIEQRLGEARETSRKAGEAAAAAQARLQAATTANSLVQEELVSHQKALERSLASYRFGSIEQAERATRTPAECATLDKGIREFEQLQASTRDCLAELEPQIVGGEVDEGTLAVAVARDKAAAGALEEAVASAARLSEQVQALRKSVARATRLESERAAVSRTLATTGEMAADLRNDAFQEYLLEEAFKALVVGASTRLREMSRRYTMEWKAGEFYVLDHDNAGERRGAQTLSGGETFMASLCLALQLSDEVLHVSGAIRMDSLFIDEGFGTLDDGSLSEVTDALENLREGGDRMVGVISHRPELTDRLPGCIRIDKGVGESRWLVERVG